MTDQRNSDTNPVVGGGITHSTSDSSSVSEDSKETIWTIFWIFVSCCAFLYDYGTDIWFITDCFSASKTNYGVFALLLTVIPSFAKTWVSCHLHYLDKQKAQAAKQKAQPTGLNVEAEEQQEQECFIERIGKRDHIDIFDVLCVFKLSPCIDTLLCLHYAWKVRDLCRRRVEKNCIPQDHAKFLKQQEDVALLGIIGSFMESAPQFILQLYILNIDGLPLATTAAWLKMVGSSITLVVLACSGKSYHCNIRLAQHDKAVVTSPGRFTLILWNLGMIISRISLTLIALWMSVWCTLSAYAIIWFGWMAWIYYKKDGVFKFSRSDMIPRSAKITWIEQMRITAISSILAVVYFFMYINLEKKPTFHKYLFYYTLWLIQIITINTVWFCYEFRDIERNWFSIAIPILSMVSFIIGIIFMLIYHQFLHPTTEDERSKSLDLNNKVTCIEFTPENNTIHKKREKLMVVLNVANWNR